MNLKNVIHSAEDTIPEDWTIGIYISRDDIQVCLEDTEGEGIEFDSLGPLSSAISNALKTAIEIDGERND